MNTFKELYQRIALSVEHKKTDHLLDELYYDPYHLECVFDPNDKLVPWSTYLSSCTNDRRSFIDCLFKHLEKDEMQNYIVKETSKQCRECIEQEKISKMMQSKDNIAVLEAIHEGKQPVYACIAPAFLSQFKNINDGQLRSAFKQIGFKGVIEVSLFADILTLKEALEFDNKIHEEEDYLLTSCCCPIWIQMVKKAGPEMLSRVPKSVSPMIATGRVIKKLVPNAMTVFIGPCLAKKAEIKEEDISDAIDVVLTFREVNDIFEAAKINPENLVSDVREHSSSAGRIYAISSGVSQAVENTLKRIRPNKPIQVKSMHANGIKECKDLLQKITEKNLKANFIEGMGCVGGCVGGPRAITNKEEASIEVQNYAKEARYKTPIDNPYVIEMLYRLGISTIEELLEDQEIFTRHF